MDIFKHTYFFTAFVSVSLFGYGQLNINLVSNGSFEQNHNCPTTSSQSSGQFSLVADWMNPSIGWLSGSPDYFNACASGVLDVPSNYLGYQYARTGDAYCGIAITSFAPNYSEFREYIEAPLKSTLVAGTCYLFEMFINAPNRMNIASDAVQVLFSDTAIIVTNSWNRLNFFPQLSNSKGNFPDSLNWKLMSGTYIANGGEKYLVIGNFLRNELSDTITIGAEAPKYGDAYIYIDDVSLISKGNYCFSSILEDKLNHKIALFPNPANDAFTLSFSNSVTDEDIHYVITDHIGQTIKEDQVKINNNSIIVSTENLKSGVYHIHIRNQLGSFTKRFIKAQ